MHRFVAILCLLLFSLQFIPVKSICKLLNKSQNTEEVQQDDNDDDCGGTLALCDIDQVEPFSYYSAGYKNYYYHKKTKVAMNFTDALLSVHVMQMPAPPPDC